MDKDLLKTLSIIDEHNADACFLSENALSNFTECYDTGCYALNAILTGKLREGGVPQGRIIGFSGESGTGKTLITCKILANAQKKGVIPVIFDSEIQLIRTLFVVLALILLKLSMYQLILLRSAVTR